MQEFKDKFLANKIQPQVFTLLLLTIILIVLSIVIYTKVKQQKPDRAPDGILYFAEQYVMGVENLYNQATEKKFVKPAPYIFTLLSLIGLGNLMGLIGFDAPATTYSFTLTLGLIAWIGIYVIGIMYQRWKFFTRFLNPIGWIGQFAPLISISFRLFGNIIGGTTIMYLIYNVAGWVWGMIPIIGEFNLLGSIIAPTFHIYFDIFEGLIQAFVFTLLTMVYWAIEANPSKPKQTSDQTIAHQTAQVKIKH